MTMGTVGNVNCPHCGATNEPGAAFCGTCGKAVSTGAAGPRIITGSQFATTTAGMKLQSDELQAQAKKAAGALLAVAIIQTIFGFILYGIVRSAPRSAQVNVPLLEGVIFGVAVIFWGLYFWARKAPFPAAIVGLVVYLTLWAVDLISWFVTVANNPQVSRAPGAGAGPFNGIIIKVIIVAVLIRAIGAGAKHRQLMRQQTSVG